MNQDPKTMRRDVRALLPARGLQEHEATGIAERQATRLLRSFDQHEPAVAVGLIAELPRIEVRVVPNRELAGLSGMSQWIKEHGRWLIAINRDDSQTRRRSRWRTSLSTCSTTRISTCCIRRVSTAV